MLSGYIKSFFKKRRKENRQNLFKSFGANSNLPDSTDIAGYENISIGNNVYIGPRCTFYAADAELTIGNHVMFGPEVMIITGDHRTDIKGKRLDEITHDMKKLENDQPVIIEDDCWIGARVLILKGVRIGTGSVIAAGAIVLKNVPAYQVYYSKNKMRPRFNDEKDIKNL